MIRTVLVLPLGVALGTELCSSSTRVLPPCSPIGDERQDGLQWGAASSEEEPGDEIDHREGTEPGGEGVACGSRGDERDLKGELAREPAPCRPRTRVVAAEGVEAQQAYSNDGDHPVSASFRRCQRRVFERTLLFQRRSRFQLLRSFAGGVRSFALGVWAAGEHGHGLLGSLQPVECLGQ